jgi:hypothetical protein
LREECSDELPRALHKAEVREFWSSVGKQALVRLGDGMAEGVVRLGQDYGDRAAFRNLAEAAARVT